MLNDQVMLASFLYNIRADFLFLSFAVSETYCVLLCGVKVGMSMRVILCFWMNLFYFFFLCMLCKGGATLFQASPFRCISSIRCVFCCFLNCCF